MADRTDTSPYSRLWSVLTDAFQHAAVGKGKERHAREGQRFEDQRMVQLGLQLGMEGPIFQACKKSQEACNLDYERARSDLLGAINYLAGAVIVLDELERRKKNAI